MRDEGLSKQRLRLCKTRQRGQEQVTVYSTDKGKRDEAFLLCPFGNLRTVEWPTYLPTTCNPQTCCPPPHPLCFLTLSHIKRKADPSGLAGGPFPPPLAPFPNPYHTSTCMEDAPSPHYLLAAQGRPCRTCRWSMSASPPAPYLGPHQDQVHP